MKIECAEAQTRFFNNEDERFKEGENDVCAIMSKKVGFFY